MITVRCLQVESLTAARKSALNGQEPSDAIRVVNAFLTQIDQIKRYFQNKFSYGPAIVCLLARKALLFKFM